MANAFEDTVYRGLNVAKSLSDIGDRDVALVNLGLKRDNLNLIKGLGGLITTQEFHNISGLVDDQRRMLDSLEASSIAAGEIAEKIRNVSNDQKYNFAIDNKLIAGTIKYNYVNFDGDDGGGNPQWNLKSADISTSRVSSWSPFGPEDNPDQLITYNSEVLNTGEFLALTELALTSEPQQKRKRSQVPTDKLTLNINGANVQFPVMRGIPFRFVAGGSTIEFDAHLIESGGSLISDFQGFIPVEFEKTSVQTEITTIPLNEAGGSEFVPDISANGEGTYHIGADIDNSNVTGNVYLDVFYNPSLIRKLRMRNNNMVGFAETVFTGLEDLDISNNDFENIPNFLFSAPNLKHINLRNNPLDQGPNSAEVSDLQFVTGYTGTPNEQLARLPLGMVSIDDRGCWEDLPGNLDISYDRFPDLVNLNFGESSFPGSTTNLQTGGDGVAPAVYDPNYKLIFDPTDSNVLDPSTGEFTFVAHRFTSGDKVRYKNRVAPDNPNFVMGGGNAGTGGQDSTMLAGTLCEELSPLSRNDILQVEVVDLNTIKLRTSPYGSGNVISSYTLASDTGTYHTLEKWDDVNNKLHFEADRGVEGYNPEYVDYRFVPVAYLNSQNLLTWGPPSSSDSKQYRADCIAEYRFVDSTNSTTLDISNEDRKFRWANEENLTSIDTRGSDTCVPVLHNMPSLTKLQFGPNMQMGFGYRLEDRKFDQQSLFGGLNTPTTSLKNIYLYLAVSVNAGDGANNDTKKGVWGDMSTILHGQTNLERFEMSTFDFPRLTLDGNFFKDCPKLRYASISGNDDHGRGSSIHLHKSPLNYDVFGVDGSTSARQGNLFPSQTGSDPRLTNIRLFGFKSQSGYLINETTTPPIDLIKFDTLDPNPTSGSSTDVHVSVRYCHLHGRFPNMSGSDKLHSVEIAGLGNNDDSMELDTNFSITPGQKYMVAQNFNRFADRGDSVQGYNPSGYTTTNRANALCFQELEDMGWDVSEVNSDHLSWADSTSRGTLVAGGSTGKPKRGDWFEYQDPDINTCIEDYQYVIVDPSGSTKAQWEALGWVANQTGTSEFGHGTTGANPAKGDTFKANNNANRIHANECIAGGKYLFIRSGENSVSTLQAYDSNITSTDDTDWKQEFNPTSDSNNYSLSNKGVVVMKRPAGEVSGNTDPAVDYGTGKVVRDRCKKQLIPRGLTEFITDTNNEIKDMEDLRQVTVQRTHMEGDFPVFSQSTSVFYQLLVTNNKFSGPLPDVSGVSDIERYRVNNNLFDDYTSGSLATATDCKLFYMNDNKLNDYHLGPIINDLYLNSNSRSSNSGINVRLQNQSPDSGNRLNASWLQQPGNEAINDKYAVLLQRGWSITIDSLP